MKKIILVFIGLCCLFSVSPAQGITNPSEGKAVVYFVRATQLAFAINFEFFDSSKLIGKFNGQNYMRYECAPGEHLFWARSENRDFITAGLEAGKIYFVEVVPSMGWGQAVVYLKPVDPKESDRMEKIEKVVNKRTSQQLSEAELAKQNEKLKDAIPRGLQKYKDDLADGKKFKRLEKNMFYEKKNN